jgi:hypothetical protein
MPHRRWEFAIVKPAFRGQENKDEDKNAKYVILPGGSAVAPEKEAFQTAKKEAHTTLYLFRQTDILPRNGLISNS